MEDLKKELAGEGLDVLAPMRVSWYNDYLRELGLATDSTKYLERAGEAHASGEPAPFALAPLPDFGREGDALALIIGNSRAMWPCFLRWLKRKGGDIKNPVDTFAEEKIKAAVGTFAGESKYDIFWASDMSPQRLVDMNRASLVSSLCYFSDEMFLSIHPKFGSWVAFRAVVVIDLPATDLGPPPSHLPPLLSEEEAAAARSAFAEALQASKDVEVSVEGMPLHLAKKWEAMRDCVGRGREHKYSELQSEYHYVKDPKLLARALAEEA